MLKRKPRRSEKGVLAGFGKRIQVGKKGKMKIHVLRWG